MADDGEVRGGGGFGWGLFLGGLAGIAVGAYLASGPGREQVDTLRQQTIELTGPESELRRQATAAAGRARQAVSDPEHPVRRAINEGVSAARRRRQELQGELEAEQARDRADLPSAGPATES